MREGRHTQFRAFLDKNSKISGLQSGNRKFHSTVTGFLHYTDQLLKNMDEKRISVVVLRCLKLSTASKQYNLLSKLHLLGVSASALAWFKSYLSLRKQVVRIGSDLSDPSHWQWVWPRGPFSVQFCSHCTSTTFSLHRRSAKPWAVCRRHQAAFGPSPVWHQSCHFWLQWWSSRDRKVVFNKLLLINPNKTKLLVVSVPQLTRNVSLPPVVLLGTNIKLFPVERLWSLDRLCRNFRRSYI